MSPFATAASPRSRPRSFPVSASETVDVSGKLVLPGLIDTHAHVYQYVTGRFGLNADMVGVRSGVTTVVDQGGPSCMTLAGLSAFRRRTGRDARLTRSSPPIWSAGSRAIIYPNLYSPAGVDVDATVAAANANKDIVRGIKGHAEIGGFARWGIRVMEMAAEIGRRADLPLYVHFGTLWGLPESGANGEDADTILERVIPLLQRRRHSGPSVHAPSRRLRQPARAKFITSSRRRSTRGLKVDVGHGSHFSYRIARKALDAGIVPHTLGADMHGYNTECRAPPGTPDTSTADDENHPFRGQARFSLTQAMSSMMALGLPLEDVVPMVTSNAGADARPDRPDRRARRPGFAADVSVSRRRARALPPARQRRHQGGRRAAAASGLLPARRPALRRRLAHSAAGRRGVSLAAETPAPQQVWASLDQARRDAAYDNNAAVANSAALIEARNAASAAYRKAHSGALDIPYAPGARTAFDLYPAADPRAPCLVFIHGGYWLRNSRELFAAYAEGLAQHGWSIALPGYTLAPQASLTAIVQEIGAALDWLRPSWTGAWRRGPRSARRLVGRRPTGCAASRPSAGRGGPRHFRRLRPEAAARHRAQRRAEAHRRGGRGPVACAVAAGFAEAARHRLWNARASRACSRIRVSSMRCARQLMRRARCCRSPAPTISPFSNNCAARTAQLVRAAQRLIEDVSH